MASFTFRSITFDQIDQGGIVQVRSDWGQEGSRLTASYRVAWSRRFRARDALLGNSHYVALNPQFGYMSRTLPHAHDEGTDGLRRTLFCKRVSIEPYITRNPTGTDINAEYAHLKCDYGCMPYSLLEDTSIINPAIGGPDEASLARYVSNPPSKSRARMMTMRGRTWRWKGVAPERVVADGHPIPFTDGQFTKKWHQIPIRNVPWSAIFTTLNRTNQEVFDWCPAGKCLFTDYSYEEITLPGHVRAVNLIYSFIYKPDGANFFPDPDRGYAHYEVESRDGVGSPVFTSADYNALFRPVPS